MTRISFINENLNAVPSPHMLSTLQMYGQKILIMRYPIGILIAQHSNSHTRKPSVTVDVNTE